MKGKVVDEEVRKKIGEGQHKSWSRLSDAEKKVRSDKQREIFSKRKDKDIFSRQGCQAIRKAAEHGSKLERAIIAFFNESEIDYRHHYKDLLPQTQLEVDFYLPEYGVVLEVDGPSHFSTDFGVENYNQQVRADEKKNGLVLGMGLSIIRIQHRRTLYKRDHYNIIGWLKDNLENLNNEVKRVDVDEL
jgi:very-short-patch-repair endonuclease